MEGKHIRCISTGRDDWELILMDFELCKDFIDIKSELSSLLLGAAQALQR